MKIFATLLSLTLSVLCSAVTAANLDKVAVYATEKSRGSMSVGEKSAYSKTFDVVVGNLSSKNMDLSKFCLKAYSPEGDVFRLDTVSDTLAQGMLKPTKNTKGVAVFVSEDDAVYKAALIKLSDECK